MIHCAPRVYSALTTCVGLGWAPGTIASRLLGTPGSPQYPHQMQVTHHGPPCHRYSLLIILGDGSANLGPVYQVRRATTVRHPYNTLAYLHGSPDLTITSTPSGEPDMYPYGWARGCHRAGRCFAGTGIPNSVIHRCLSASP